MSDTGWPEPATIYRTQLMTFKNRVERWMGDILEQNDKIL